MERSGADVLNANPRRLLVVDDELQSRDMLSQKLSHHGYQVDVADGGEDAFAKLQKDEYDLVLLDHMMPGMSGLALLKLLRATRSANELPVIMVTPEMVTPEAQSHTIIEALDHGANDYVVKPLELPAVAARIETQLRRAKNGRELCARELPRPVGIHNRCEGPWDFDLLHNTAHFSRRWAEILGYRSEEIDNTPEEWFSRIHPDDDARVRDELRNHLHGSVPELRSEHRLRQKTGDYRWILCRGVAARSPKGQPVRITGSIADIEDSRIFDPLTGLDNRLMLMDRVAAALTRNRYNSTQVALLLLDLDGFKVVNDSFGHAVGDSLLGVIAGKLETVASNSSFAPNVTLARLGGDEFVIFLDKVAKAESAEELASSLVQSLAEPIVLCGLRLTISASIGLVVTEALGQTPGQLLRDADLAMYRAKELGKNRWTLFDDAMRKRAEKRMLIAMDLRFAIERGELVAFYQPKINLRTKVITGFEALLRWRHPERGLMAPGEFVPVAEETGLIIPMGTWILEEACHQLAEWQAAFRSECPLTMSVNLSVKQLSDPGLLPLIQSVLLETGILPSSLKLELTESSLIAEMATARDVLTRIQALGVGLKLDDFGTGYSSLSYLSSLHFDSLKIDRAFVEGLGRDAESNAIVKTIIGLAHALNMGVVAEGIETEQQLNELVNLGCESGQGFFFSAPVDAKIAEQMLHHACFVDNAA